MNLLILCSGKSLAGAIRRVGGLEEPAARKVKNQSPNVSNWKNFWNFSERKQSSRLKSILNLLDSRFLCRKCRPRHMSGPSCQSCSVMWAGILLPKMYRRCISNFSNVTIPRNPSFLKSEKNNPMEVSMALLIWILGGFWAQFPKAAVPKGSSSRLLCTKFNGAAYFLSFQSFDFKVLAVIGYVHAKQIRENSYRKTKDPKDSSRDPWMFLGQTQLNLECRLF